MKPMIGSFGLVLLQVVCCYLCFSDALNQTGHGQQKTTTVQNRYFWPSQKASYRRPQLSASPPHDLISAASHKKKKHGWLSGHHWKKGLDSHKKHKKGYTIEKKKTYIKKKKYHDEKKHKHKHHHKKGHKKKHGHGGGHKKKKKKSEYPFMMHGMYHLPLYYPRASPSYGGAYDYDYGGLSPREIALAGAVGYDMAREIPYYY